MTARRDRATARQATPILADLRAWVRRDKSLRHLTKKAIKDVTPPRTLRDRARDLRSHLWAILGTPWALPLASIAVVVALQVGFVQWSPLAVFRRRIARELLATLWQVEAAAVALVLAGALFAFESLTRQRPELSLSDYAARSGLTHFFAWASSGLLAVPVVLFSTPRIPAPSASLAAATIAVGGLAALPFFFSQAMKVVHPGWLQRARTDELRRSMQNAVRADVTRRFSVGILQEWARANAVEVSHRIGYREDQPAEVSGGDSETLDIHLGRLKRRANEHPNEISILTYIGESVWKGAPLVVTRSTNGLRRKDSVVTTSRGRTDNQVERLIQDLHSEAVDAIHRGSVRAAEAAAELQTEVWLAWPREWATYGQSLHGGLLRGLEPFRLGPTGQLKRNLHRQLALAVDRGLQDHVQAIQSISWKVALESIDLGAVDLAHEMTQLAQSFLTIRSSHYPDLVDHVVERAWRFQAELCEYAARGLFRDGSVGADQEDALAFVEVYFGSIVESLRILLELGRYKAFLDLDHRFQQLLEGVEGEHERFRAQHTVEDPDADENDIAQAKQVLALSDAIEKLKTMRRAGRLSLLGWELRLSDKLERSDDFAASIQHLAQTLGSVDEIVEAAAVALDHRRTFVSNWTILDLPEGEAGFVDEEGPVLNGVAAGLLAKAQVNAVPPQSWMTANRIERLIGIVGEMAGSDSLWSRRGERRHDVQARVSELKRHLTAAEKEQRSREQLELVQQPLDPMKVDQYKASVVAGWSQHRVLADFASVAKIDLQLTPVGPPEMKRYGWVRLHPKGLYVSPTNWVGLEQNAQEAGRHLAQEEVSALVRLATEHGVEFRATGEARERLETLLSAFREEGYEPTIVLIPIHWRLVDALGLRAIPPAVPDHPLGRQFKGEIEGVPVVEWWQVPEDRMYVADGPRFWSVKEGELKGVPAPPEVGVSVIDERRAAEITSTWSPAEDADAERERRLQLLTNVEVRVERPFQAEALDEAAARYVTFVEPRKHQAPRGTASETPVTTSPPEGS